MDEKGIRGFRPDSDEEDYFSDDSNEEELLHELELAEKQRRKTKRRIEKALPPRRPRTASDPAFYRLMGEAPQPQHGSRPLTINGLQASAIAARDVPMGKYGGVCPSAVRTGRPPQMPLHRQLINQAMTQGLYSECQDEVAIPPPSPRRAGLAEASKVHTWRRADTINKRLRTSSPQRDFLVELSTSR